MPFSALLHSNRARSALLTFLLLVPAAQAQEQTTASEATTVVAPPAQTQTLVTSSGQGFPWGLLGLLGLMGLGRRSKTVVVSEEATRPASKPPKPRPSKKEKISATPPATDAVEEGIAMDFGPAEQEQVFYAEAPEPQGKVKIGR